MTDTEEFKKIVQTTIDRLLYAGQEYIKQLNKLNEEYKPQKQLLPYEQVDHLNKRP